MSDHYNSLCYTPNTVKFQETELLHLFCQYKICSKNWSQLFTR